MDHIALDGTWTHQRDLDDEVVKTPRIHAREHGHLSAALDLKDTHSLPPRDHLESRRVIVRNAGHGERLSFIPIDEIEGSVQMCQGTKPKQVHLKQAEVLDVVFVPLDDSAILHGGGLYRDHLVDALVPEQEPAWVDGEMPWEILNLFDER